MVAALDGAIVDVDVDVYRAVLPSIAQRRGGVRDLTSIL